MTLIHESVTLPPSGNYPLHITAKRYWTHQCSSTDPDALTLLFLHSTSFHKETWEPTIESLFTLLFSAPLSPASSKSNSKGTSLGNVKIREVWAIDCPNHGAAVELNEEALRLPEFFNNFTCEKYAVAVHRFLTQYSSPGHPPLSSRPLVGVGHSLGSVALTILQQLTPRVPIQYIVLVEPMLSPHGSEYLTPLRKALVRSAYERRDVWRTRSDAYEALKARARTRDWDPRILKLFVEHAIRSHPASKFLDAPFDGVTLCCTRDQEAAMYRDTDGPIKPVLDLNKACAEMPVHLVFGDINDYIPREVHDAVTDPKSGRRYASITRLQGVGHLVPQQAPEKLAGLLCNILQSHWQDQTATSLPPTSFKFKL